MNSLLRRGGGLGLIVLSLGPMIAFVGGITVVIVLCAGAVRSAGERIAGIAAIVSGEIVPQVQKVQARYAVLASQAEEMKTQVDKVMLAVTQIQDLRIQPGQLGSTPAVRLHIPERDVSFASGAVKINDGELFNQTLPGVQIPPGPVAMPLAPLRTAFAPFGPDGPVGQAIGASQRELEATFGELTKLQQPLRDIEMTVVNGLGPLEAVVVRIARIGLATLAALGLLLATYIAAGILLAVYWPHESGTAYRTGGTLGYAAFIHRTLLSNGLSRLFGGATPSSPEATVAGLAQMVARLEAEVAMLRAERRGSQLPAAP